MRDKPVNNPPPVDNPPQPVQQGQVIPVQNVQVVNFSLENAHQFLQANINQGDQVVPGTYDEVNSTVIAQNPSPPQ